MSSELSSKHSNQRTRLVAPPQPHPTAPRPIPPHPAPPRPIPGPCPSPHTSQPRISPQANSDDETLRLRMERKRKQRLGKDTGAGSDALQSKPASPELPKSGGSSGERATGHGPSYNSEGSRRTASPPSARRSPSTSPAPRAARQSSANADYEQKRAVCDGYLANAWEHKQLVKSVLDKRHPGAPQPRLSPPPLNAPHTPKPTHSPQNTSPPPTPPFQAS